MPFNQEPSLDVLRPSQGEVTVTAPEMSRNIMPGLQPEQTKSYPPLFLPVTELEPQQHEMKPAGYYHPQQDDQFFGSNDGINTGSIEFQVDNFDFNQNYSFSFSNFDYSAECKNLEQELLEE